MRKTVEALCARVPLNARSRRALDETLADWAHEADAATRPMQLALASIRSVVAVTRTLVATVGDEITRVPVGPVVGRLLLVLLVPVVVLAITGWGHIPWHGDVTSVQRVTLAVYAIPQAVIALLPIALFIVAAVLERERPLPALGLSAAALLVALTVVAWMLPAGSKAFHDTINAMDSPVAIKASFAPPDMGPLDLVRSAAARPMGPAMRVLLFRAGLVAMSVTFVILGAAAGSLAGRRRSIFTATVVSSYALAVLLLPSNWELGGHAPAFVGLLPWGAAALALALAFTLGNPAPAEGVAR